MTESKNDFIEVQTEHFCQCVKEARFVVVTWIITLVYVSVVVGLMGYVPAEHRPDEPSLILGVPSWVCWGVILPWFVLIGITWWFAIFLMKDDEPYIDFPQPSEIDGLERT